MDNSQPPKIPFIIVPHADHGDPECCGLIMAVVRDEQADLTCNECGAVIRAIPVAEAETTLLEMTLEPGFCSGTCPHCGWLNIFPGFSSMEAYTCRHCGAGVTVHRPVQ